MGDILPPFGNSGQIQQDEEPQQGPNRNYNSNYNCNCISICGGIEEALLVMNNDDDDDDIVIDPDLRDADPFLFDEVFGSSSEDEMIGIF